MDWLLIVARIVHVGSAMAWFGGAVIGGFFLTPTAKALGPSGQQFMEHLLKRRRMGVFFPIVAALTVLSGAALYWRDSNGLSTGLDLLTVRAGLHRSAGWPRSVPSSAG